MTALLKYVRAVAGGSFGVQQFVVVNITKCLLTDALSAMGSLIVTLLSLRRWKPKPDPEVAVCERNVLQSTPKSISFW